MTKPKLALADRFGNREEPKAPVLDTPSDHDASKFVDMNFKVSKPIRSKHWIEAATRGVSNKKLYLMMAIAFYEKYGSLAAKNQPELSGVETLEMERGRG